MMRRNWTAIVLAGVLACSGRGHGGGDDDDSGSDGDSDSDSDADGDCADEDGDGAGLGDGCIADDCDDTDPATTDQCGSGCEDHPDRLGCPCEGAEVRSCYRGPEGTGSIGICAAGLQRCEDGELGPCSGQILPRDEVCDLADDDCDGSPDDGVTNECGTCGACEQRCIGPEDGCDPFAPEQQSAGIVPTPEGYLTLGGTAGTNLHVMWPSSSAAGSIFRYDTEDMVIDGAFWTGPDHFMDSPSRTAVDDFGNVIISNRSFSTQGSITKIASSRDDCPDLDGNGVVDTSTGWDDILPFDSHDDWDDECILWHTPVGGVGSIPRALAIHSVVDLEGVAHDYGWVGLYTDQRFVQFDVETGELTGLEAATPGLTPYGSALDRDGWIWISSLSTTVGRFDTADPDNTFEILTLPVGGQAYRVIVDENNTPWISGNDLFRYDRDDETFTPVGLVADGGFGFVGNVASDGEGSLWVGTYADGQYVYRVTNDDTLEWHTVETPGTSTFGTAVDFDGHAWAFGYTDGTATAIDIDTEETTLLMNDCGGLACLSTPYVRGDITGLQRRNALNPRGIWTGLFEGCDFTTAWTNVVIDAQTPNGANLIVSVKTADDLAALALVPWIPLGTIPPDGPELAVDPALQAAGVEPGHFLQVQVLLQSLDREAAPVLQGIRTQYGCEGVFE